MAKTKVSSKTRGMTKTELDEDNPFGALLQTVKEKEDRPVNLKSIQKPNARKKDRLQFGGPAALYNADQKVITRAVLRNISPGSLGFEISPVSLAKDTLVFVQFDGPRMGLGLIECRVQWIAEIEKGGNKMVGLKISKLTPSIQKQMQTLFNFVDKE